MNTRWTDEEEKILLAWMPLETYLEKKRYHEKFQWQGIASELEHRTPDDIRFKCVFKKKQGGND